VGLYLVHVSAAAYLLSKHVLIKHLADLILLAICALIVRFLSRLSAFAVYDVRLFFPRHIEDAIGLSFAQPPDKFQLVFILALFYVVIQPQHLVTSLCQK
jgi:hypothetical protein